MKTIVYIAHDNLAQSSSQQFLQQSGKALTDAMYVDLQAEWQQQGGFNATQEHERLLHYDRIIFQFPLYWYQAPAVLKIWLDSVFDLSPSMERLQSHLATCQLGIVVVAGVKASEYQPGGREQCTLAELLSPYEAFARFFKMVYLPPLAVHQFQYMTEEMQFELMFRYACYLQTGTVDEFDVYQSFLVEKIATAQLDLTEEQQVLFDFFEQELVEQQDEWRELSQITQDW